MNKPKILVIGSVCNISGYSEHARTLVDALMTLDDKIDLYIQNTQWAMASTDIKYVNKYGNLLEKTHNFLATRADKDGNVNLYGVFDMSFQVRPPNEFQKVTPFDVGVTAALETTSAPGNWVNHCNQMSHILVVSQHAKKNLVNTKAEDGSRIATPISIVPFGNNPSITTTDIYQEMGLTTSFNFLTVSQMAPRKNIQRMLAWFLQEFGNNEDVGLVIKSHTHNSSTADFHATRQYLRTFLDHIQPDRKCKVYFTHGNFSEERMLSLYDPNYIDCYITATHGEGFGIPIFNAACAGIPIVATNWSGHLDYLRMPTESKTGKKQIKSQFVKVNYDIAEVKQEHLMPGLIVEGCEWAYPKEQSFKVALRQAYSNNDQLKEGSQQLAEYVKQNYDISEIHKMYIDFVNSHLNNRTADTNDDQSTFFL
jgi:glycosyltransferase involved in cell wall biosynthesis